MPSMLKRAILKWLFSHKHYRCLIIARYIVNHCNNKQIIIYGSSDDIILLGKYLKFVYKKNCKFIIKEPNASNNSESIEVRDLISNKNNYYIFVPMSETLRKDISDLIDLGLNMSDINYFYYRTRNLDVNRPLDCYDVNLGYTRIDDLPGFSVFGNYETAKLKIAVLGNSTSDPKFAYMKSWPEYLYENLKKSGYNVSILCGGILNYNSSQELIKLIRDVIPRKPDVVITLSGVCNIWNNYHEKLLSNRPFVWQFQKELLENNIKHNKIRNKLGANNLITSSSYGLENNKSYSAWWVDDMRMMKALCNEFNIEFYAFLQPNMYIGSYKRNGLEYSKMEDDYIEGIKNWYIHTLDLSKNLRYIHNITDIFDDEIDVYWDTCHTYEKGSRIIAERILNEINLENKNSI